MSEKNFGKMNIKIVISISVNLENFSFWDKFAQETLYGGVVG